MREVTLRFRRSGKTVCLTLLFLAVSLHLWGQTSLKERITATVFAEAAFPILGDEALFTAGFGANASLEYSIFPFFAPFFQGGFHLMPVRGLQPVSLFDAGLGVGFRFNPTERINLRAGALGGLYSASWSDYAISGLFFGLRAEGGYRISPAVTLSVHGGFSDYLSSPDPFLRMISAGVSVNLRFASLGRKTGRVDVRTKMIEPIFPIFYSYYDENTFGAVEIVSLENSEIRDVAVSVFIPEYMSRTRRCGFRETLDAGEGMEVPLYALLNDEVLGLTENTRVQALLTVEYRLMGSRRRSEIPMELTMYHRNAMTWDDDRKAAAFVSPTDPAVLWFSRFASGLARDRMRGSINGNLQQAVGMFEALRVYGIHYVIDPNSPYVELSEHSASVDYLQFPHQTLFFRGGDCDDLSILYTALLESVGIRTAFITIPGHIYMAFALDMSEEDARRSFYDPSMLIFVDGEAWVPVEITLVKEGFLKAWRIGAKEWIDNAKTGNAAFYPVDDCWVLYPPAGIPNVNPRFSLPDEVETIRMFDTSMDRYVAREITPMKDAIASRSDLSETRKQNSLGTLFGRYGMLDEAWARFSEAAKSQHTPAWINLGNIAFLQKDYELAIRYYEWGLKLEPGGSLALLGIARSRYELEQLEASDRAYAELKTADPELASRFGYLASVFGGDGRAWTFSDRLGSTVWAEEPEEVRPPAPAVASVPDSAVALSPAPVPPAEEVIEPESAVPVAALLPQTEEPEPAVQADPPAETAARDDDRADDSPVEEAPPEEPAADEPETPQAAEESPQTADLSGEAGPDTADIPPEAADLEPENFIEDMPPPAPPPEIAERLPEDREIREKEETAAARQLAEELRAAAAAVTVPDVLPESGPGDDTAPEIAEILPEDRELTEKAETAALQRAVADEPEVEAEGPSELPVPQEAEAEPELTEPEPPIPGPPTPKPPAPGPTETADGPAPEAEEELTGELESVVLADSFRPGTPGRGRWQAGDARAEQSEEKQLFAKLAVPVKQNSQLTRYSFSSRSTGSGWTGLGLHIYRDEIETPGGYGAGKSILVWITHDPNYYGDEYCRLQIYRSHSDTEMELLHSVIIPETVFDTNLYTIIFDRIRNSVTVLINGNKRLELDEVAGFEYGEYVVFRSLDTCEFEDFSMEVLQWKGQE